MNNKGFTLVEVLAIVLLLGLLSLIVVPKVLEQRDSKKAQISESEKKILYSDAEEYVRENSEYIQKPGNVFCISVSTLIDNDKVSINADEFSSKYIKISVDDNYNFLSSLENNCERLFSNAKQYVKNNNSYIKKPGNVFCIKGSTLSNEVSFDISEFANKYIKISIDTNYKYNSSLEDNCTEINS